MQYTVLAMIALALTLALAIRAKLPAKPLIALAFIAVISQLIFDNIMASAGLWKFDFSQTLGIAVPVIPLENLMFGLALAIATVVSWEKRKNQARETGKTS